MAIVENRADTWPESGLETVPRCPVCGHGERKLVHAGLRDRIFCCAPGQWNIHQCHDCGSGYLDPRPTPATIGLAYKQYMTHSPTGGVDYATASWWRRFRIKQRNGYLNANYGYNLKPAVRGRCARWVGKFAAWSRTHNPPGMRAPAGWMCATACSNSSPGRTRPLMPSPCITSSSTCTTPWTRCVIVGNCSNPEARLP